MQEETVLAAGAAEESAQVDERAIDNRPYEENGEGAVVGAHSMRPSDTVQVRRAIDNRPYGEGDESHRSDGDEKRERFRALVGGEFKDVYTEEVQRIIDRRFKKMKLLEQRLAELEGDGGCPSSGSAEPNHLPPEGGRRAIDNRPYGTGDDGATVDQLIEVLMENEQREAQVRRDAERLQRDVAALRERYPDLDTAALLDSDTYLRAYLDGAPLEDLLWAKHHDALVRSAQQSVVENIRARGARPLENGASGGATFTVHKDFSKMTLDELEAYGSKR